MLNDGGGTPLPVTIAIIMQDMIMGDETWCLTFIIPSEHANFQEHKPKQLTD